PFFAQPHCQVAHASLVGVRLPTVEDQHFRLARLAGHAVLKWRADQDMPVSTLHSTAAAPAAATAASHAPRPRVALSPSRHNSAFLNRLESGDFTFSRNASFVIPLSLG